MLLGHVVRFLHAWWRYNITVRQLSLLSDHQLADLGLTRAQISAAAYRRAWDSAQAADAGCDPRTGRADR